MLHVLGRSVGLNVQGLEVPISTLGHLTDDQGHWACLVHLADGRVAIADATGILADNVFVSKPFAFAETYRKADYWELRDIHNPLRLHALVQPLDNDGLVQESFYRAAKWMKSGNPKLTDGLLTEAIRRNPKCATFYSTRGCNYATWGDKDRAAADYRGDST